MNRKPESPILLAKTVQDFFNEHLNNSDFLFSLKLWQNWHKFIVSSSLKNTKPVSYQNGRLYLWVVSSVESQEIHFYKEELKQTINDYFKKDWIKNIYFTVNKDQLKKREQSIKLLEKIDLK